VKTGYREYDIACMNTPGHIVLNLALLGKWDSRGKSLPIVIGSALPDVPIFLFYIYQRFYSGVSEIVIWSIVYYIPVWQNLFDTFHSLPLVIAGTLVFYYLGHLFVSRIFAGMTLHSLVDLFLHAEDGHLHFFPFHNFRFESPVSYWDPQHFGFIGAGLELVVVAIASLVILKRENPPWVRKMIYFIWLFYVAGTTLLILYLSEII
jgi:hypothetical protein